MTCLTKKGVNIPVFRPDSPYKKWAQSRDQYEFDHYPTYCNGPCALISANVMETIYTFSRQTNPGKMTIEDALFTGVIRVKANLSEPAHVGNICTHLIDDFYDKVTKLRSWQYINTGLFLLDLQTRDPWTVCPFLIDKAIKRNNALNFCLDHFIPLTQCFINLKDENGDDIDDSELFFKRPERTIQGHNGNNFLVSTSEII